MTSITTLDRRRIFLEIHALLRDSDPSRWRDDVASAMRARLVAIQEGAAQLAAAARADDKLAKVQARLVELSQSLKENAPRRSMPSKEEIREEWMAFRARVLPQYEALVVALRAQAIQIPSLRPTNYARSIFHASAALGSIALMEFVLPLWSLPYATGAWLVFSWSLEISRRFSSSWNDRLMNFGFFKLIAHARERHNVNSATWYVTALFVLSLVQSQLVAAAALAVLGLADPAAAAIGRRWGRTHLINGRSLEGSLTFVGVGMLAAIAALHVLHPEASWPASIAVAASAAFFGALAELFSKRLDDNLTIPLTAAAGAGITAVLLNVPV